MTRNDFLVLIAAVFLAVLFGLALGDILFDTGLGLYESYPALVGFLKNERVVNVETSAGRQSEEGRVSQDSITDTDPDISSLGFSTITAEVSAYTSDPNQTDDEPCISASGIDLCKYPFGSSFSENEVIEKTIISKPFPITKTEILSFPIPIACPSKYNFRTILMIKNQKYICLDRMNKRYRDGNYFDIYMSSYEEAMEWGRREVEVKIYK